MGIFDGLVPVSGDIRISGITTGKVKDNWDEEHQGMVKVEYFLGEKGQNVTGWVPVASPYAYKNCGLYLLPEVGSEVVIAFEMGDRNCPIVIGSLWNKKNTIPKKTAKEKNTVKRFKTKGGCEVIFDDEEGKESICVQTPKNLHIKLDDEKKTITMQDKEGKNGITIHTETGSMTIKAEKKMVLEVGGKAVLTMEGEGETSLNGEAAKIKMHASQTLNLKGQSASLEGGGTLELKGGSSLKAHSSGAAELKGTVVKIN